VNREKKKKTYSEKEIEKIILDNENLSEQVKRLVKTEYALYNTQSELDNQIIIYKGLYETGKKTSTSLKIDSIFSEMGNFIIDKLNFGGYLLFERKKASCVLAYSGGCCSGKNSSNSSCDHRWMETILAMIRESGDDCTVTGQPNENVLLTEAREFFGFSEFVLHPFYIGSRKTAAYLLVVGNPPAKEYFTAVLPNTIAIIGLGNLVSLVENALNNVIHYRQLIEERKLLEMKVDERTKDLNDAMKNMKKLNARLHFLSYKDELTGLYNRRGLLTVGEKYFNMARRKNTELLILFCDLDRFKQINDVFGHAEGDFALRQTAEILKSAFRDYDIISRFGGDEFVIMLDNASTSNYGMLKRRLNAALLEYNDRSGKGYRISISCGYADYKRDRRPDAVFEGIIDQADKMLYSIKKKRARSRCRRPE
jgi:diguanylate cyclase (GGDEF)-like protein